MIGIPIFHLVTLPTWIEGNVTVTIKFENQFTAPLMLVAAGLGPWENSSAIINHGIEPVGGRTS